MMLSNASHSCRRSCPAATTSPPPLGSGMPKQIRAITANLRPPSTIPKRDNMVFTVASNTSTDAWTATVVLTIQPRTVESSDCRSAVVSAVRHRFSTLTAGSSNTFDISTPTLGTSTPPPAEGATVLLARCCSSSTAAIRPICLASIPMMTSFSPPETRFRRAGLDDPEAPPTRPPALFGKVTTLSPDD